MAFLRDPLLTAARLVVGGAIAFLGLIAAATAFGFAAAVTAQRATVSAKLHAAGVGGDNLPAVLLAIALVFAMVAFYILFMRELYRIVRSVDAGDPFTPLNAGRLQRMGWLNLAVQMILLALAAIGVMLGNWKTAILAEDAINLGIGAIVLTLVLFVLARVFRVGAAMREELEGTV